MRILWASISLATLAACGPTPQTMPQNAAQCRDAAARYAGQSFATESDKQAYFSKVVTGVIDDNPTQRFIYLECLAKVGELPAGVTYEKSGGQVPTTQRSRYSSDVMSGGSGYRTAPYDSQAALKSSVPMNAVEVGSIELPTRYPLEAGDKALWASMSPTQRSTAISYLQAGGTITSSLAGG